MVIEIIRVVFYYFKSKFKMLIICGDIYDIYLKYIYIINYDRRVLLFLKNKE